MTRLFLIVVAGVLILYGVAVLAVAAYYVPENNIEYSSIVTPGSLIRAITHVDQPSLGMALDMSDLPFFVGIVFAVLVFTATLANPNSRARTFALLAQFVIVFTGWFGIFMCLVAPVVFVIRGIDGEFLGEHWPTTVVQGLWLFACAILAATNQHMRERTQLDQTKEHPKPPSPNLLISADRDPRERGPRPLNSYR